MIEPLRIPDLARVVPTTSSDERHPPPKRQPQRRHDPTPTKNVYTPEGVLEEEENPKIDLVG